MMLAARAGRKPHPAEATRNLESEHPGDHPLTFQLGLVFNPSMSIAVRNTRLWWPTF